MPPWWKIRRELVRLRNQTLELPERLFTKLLGWAFYDLFLKKNSKIYEGKIPLGNAACIFVIFPHGEDLSSELIAIQYLIEKKISPIVVSNKALNTSQIEQLRPITTLTLERKNFGYDFGGYRDGMLILKDKMSELDFIILLNDSTWFPVNRRIDWIDECLTLDFDFCAATSSSSIGRRKYSSEASDWWTTQYSSANFHYCSYALMFKQRLLKENRFINFFRFFPLTNNKSRTVRRGEIGLTRWIKKSAYSHGAVFKIESLPHEIGIMSAMQTKALFQSLTLLDNHELISLKDSLTRQAHALDEKSSQVELNAVKDFILYAVARQGISYSLPRYLIENWGFPFLKKSIATFSHENKAIVSSISESLLKFERLIKKSCSHQK